MGKKIELTCIGCPMGCQLQVEMDSDKVIKVTGNLCKRGEIYGKKECINPTRIITTSVMVEGGVINVVSVKTEKDVPKSKIYEVIEELKEIIVKAPIKIGDVIVENIAQTGINIIATKNVEEK